MADFFYEYFLFLAKTVTIVGALILVLLVVAARSSDRDRRTRERLDITPLNKRYKDIEQTLLSVILSKEEWKKRLKKIKQEEKHQSRSISADRSRKRIFVIDFDGDIRAAAVANLREEITAVLTTATPADEVFVRLESAGGLVHSYGLGASQLQRVRERNIPLTVSVDKIAASGGYMMACVANKIIAAPFAIVGSIGVLAQLPNFNRFLKKHDIDFEMFTAGKYKRTVTLFGENTDEGRAKFRQELEQMHELFKRFIAAHRPQVDLDHVATGEHWLAQNAHALHLVDELITSDDYLFAASKEADLFEIRYSEKKPLAERFSELTGRALDRLTTRWVGRNPEQQT